MSLADASNAREVYERCASHAELLKHTKVPAVKKVAHSIRSWKSRHSRTTLDQAFAEHRQSILFPKAEATSSQDTDAAALSTTSSLQPPLVAPTTLLVELPSPSPPSQQEPPAPPRSPASDEGAAEPPSGQQQQRRQQEDLIAGLVRDVAALRGLQLQRQTPFPLSLSSIDKRFRKDCRVLSIVGDGRCQLYSLLQVERAMVPTAYEADELRKRLKAYLLSSYTEMEWRERVPSDLREIISLQQFAERYLSHSTSHLPHDSIALWQDMLERQTDVFILNRSPQGEHVEQVPCRGTARDAVVLLFTWQGVGHYELITYNHVISLPRHHPFIIHLEVLHARYISELSKQVKRAARIGMERKPAEREADLEVEDDAVDGCSAQSLPTSSTDQPHLDKLKLQLNALRQLLKEKTAEIDNLNRLNAELTQQLLRQDSDRLPQPDVDSPQTGCELRHSATFLDIAVPPTPDGSGVIILPPPTSLEIPPTPADPCCICTTGSADTALLPCRHRVCQLCWMTEKGEQVRMHRRKRRRCRELDLAVDSFFFFLCPLCRQAVKDDDVEPSKRVAQTIDHRGKGRGKGHGRGRGGKGRGRDQSAAASTTSLVKREAVR